MLNQAGFLTVTRTDAPSDTVPVGMVIGTDPPRARPRQKTAPIKLLVSTGPDQIEVPNVVGQTQDAAASQLTGLGFNVDDHADDVGAGEQGQGHLAVAAGRHQAEEARQRRPSRWVSDRALRRRWYAHARSPRPGVARDP